MKCKCGIEWTLVSDNKYVATNARSMPSKFCPDCGQELAIIPKHEPGTYIVEGPVVRGVAMITETGEWYVVHENLVRGGPQTELITDPAIIERCKLIRKINVEE